MNRPTITTIIKFGNSKHCFLVLVDSYERKSNKASNKLKRNDEIVVYEAELSPVQKAYFSVHSLYGELSSGDMLEINGLYGHKIGVKDGDPLVLRKITSPCPKAKRVSVEPVSSDDWEILERNAGRVEQVLLDHVRVVWPGQVFPVWIHRTMVVFMKILKLEPTSLCVVLETNTEIIVSQKGRDVTPPNTLQLPSFPQQQLPSNQNVRGLHNRSTTGFGHQSLGSPCRSRSRELLSTSELENVDTLEPKPVIPKSPSRSPRGSHSGRRNTPGSQLSASCNMQDKSLQDRGSDLDNFKPMVRRQSSLMESVMRYIFPSYMSEYRSGHDGTSDSQSDSDAGSAIDYSMQNLPSRSSVLRVQPLDLTCTLEDCLPRPRSEATRHFQQASNFKSLWEMRGQQQVSQSLDLTQKFNNFQEASSRCEVLGELFQPSTIYVDAEYTKNERLLHPYLPHLPHNFIARLTRIPSPREKAAAAQKPARKKSNSLKTGGGPFSSKESKESAARKTSGHVTSPTEGQGPGKDVGGDGGEDSVEVEELRPSCFVRVVAIDRKEGLTDEAWQEAADNVLSEQPLLHGHALIPDMLRRQLRLDATSSVWLQTGTVDLVIPRKVAIFPLTSVPKRITKEMIISAFRHYIKQTASTEHPLVVFQGLFVRFMIFPGTSVEAQITFHGENDVSPPHAVTMLSEVNIESVLVTYEAALSEDRLGVVNPRLAYFHAKDIDPQPFPVRLRNLGGVEKIAKEALQHLLACVGARPLSRHNFRSRAGISHGLLLITGPRGSGKTALVKALCRKLSHLPVMAYIILVDCKTLRGKTVSNIQKAMEAVFDEAAWREPSVIVFDNLDVIAPAPSGPETAINGEALYSAKNSQVLQGLLKYEIANNSRVTVIATSQSQSSLHPSLVSSRGVHYMQKSLHLVTPDKTSREAILRSIIQHHSSITVETAQTLNLAMIASRTEGYVARDLESLVNRSLHRKLGGVKNERITLTDEDFESELCDFKPASIRNVALHKAGDLGWNDVGGLSEVKRSLVETLHWPTKYPQLFDSCPLRLRSGILLYGAPGTGKTLLAGVVAKECGLNFISVKGPEILSKYIGASEQAVRDLFSGAQSAKPCILFFDEFDSIAPRRGHDSTGVTDRVVNQLLTQLDGVEGLSGVYVLGATSRPDLIDPALLRPGRLDKCIKCDLPDKVERCAILEVLSRKMSLAADVQLSVLADMCKYFTGADLKALLYNAQLKAIHEHADTSSIPEGGVVRIRGGEQCELRRRGSSLLGELQGQRSRSGSRPDSRSGSRGDLDKSVTSNERSMSNSWTDERLQSEQDTLPSTPLANGGSTDTLDMSWNHVDGTWNTELQEQKVLSNPGRASEAKNVSKESKASGSDVYTQDFNDDDDDDDDIVDGIAPPVDKLNLNMLNNGDDGCDVVDGLPSASDGKATDKGANMQSESVLSNSVPHKNSESDSLSHKFQGRGNRLHEDMNSGLVAYLQEQSKNIIHDDEGNNVKLTPNKNVPPLHLSGVDQIQAIVDRLKTTGDNIDVKMHQKEAWHRPKINFIASSPDPAKGQMQYECDVNNLGVDLITAVESPVQALGIKPRTTEVNSRSESDSQVPPARSRSRSPIEVKDADPAQTYPPVSVSRRRRAYERNASYPVLQDEGSQESLPVFEREKTPGRTKDRPLVVFTSLEAGLAKLSADDEARYLTMVKSIQQRDKTLFSVANDRRRTSLQLATKPGVLLQVSMRHLLEAARHMRPSVSEAERAKYLNIYEKFTASRKSDFDPTPVPSQDIGNRATLA